MIHLRPIEDADLPFLRSGLREHARRGGAARPDGPRTGRPTSCACSSRPSTRTTRPTTPTRASTSSSRATRPLGRLYVHRGETDIRIVDIALLPEHRGRGIGSHLLRAILDEAAKRGRTVSIHVERFNPALRLYERLGFAHVADTGVYYLMEWRPPADAGTFP